MFSVSTFGEVVGDLFESELSHHSACESAHQDSSESESESHQDCSCGCEVRRGSCCLGAYLITSSRNIFLYPLGLDTPQVSRSLRLPFAPILEGPFQPPKA